MMPRTRPAPRDPDAIRATLRSLVAADGRTQAEISEAAGMGQSQLAQVLHGHRPNPGIGTVDRIRVALGVPWAAFDRSAPDPPPRRRGGAGPIGEGGGPGLPCPVDR